MGQELKRAHILLRPMSPPVGNDFPSTIVNSRWAVSCRAWGEFVGTTYGAVQTTTSRTFPDVRAPSNTGLRTSPMLVS